MDKAPIDGDNKALKALIKYGLRDGEMDMEGVRSIIKELQ